MGCSHSRLEPDEEVLPSSLQPAHTRRLPGVRIRRAGGRGRKDSIVSTTELLRRDDPEDDTASSPDCDVFGADSPPSAKATEDSPALEKAEEPKGSKEEKVDGSGEKEGVKEGFRLGEEERGVMTVKIMEKKEELPGSPSFRFYFEEASAQVLSDDDLVKAIARKDHGNLDKTKKDNSRGLEDQTESLHSDESLESKSSKKDKGGRFRVLKKRPGMVYFLLNGRGCYSNHLAASSRVKPQLLHETAA